MKHHAITLLSLGFLAIPGLALADEGTLIRCNIERANLGISAVTVRTSGKGSLTLTKSYEDSQMTSAPEVMSYDLWNRVGVVNLGRVSGYNLVTLTKSSSCETIVSGETTFKACWQVEAKVDFDLPGQVTKVWCSEETVSDQ